MGRTKKKTPDRWEQYMPMGKVIEGTRFVAFKTPLKQSLCTRIDKNDHFNVSHVLMEVTRLGRRLGMVVDLTNTDRYYDSNDLTMLGVEYVKLNCPGHEVDGREDIVDKFIYNIDSFLSRHPDEDLLIGVHCTHGINRTGYLISRYLIDRCDWSADAAMGAFEAGRGYAIERGNYVLALNRAEAQRKSGRRGSITMVEVVVSENAQAPAPDVMASETDSVSVRERPASSDHKITSWATINNLVGFAVVGVVKRTWEVKSESSDEASKQQKKKKKKKAKKRSKNDTSTVPDADEMQQMWQMMVGAAQTMMTSGAVSSPVYGMPNNPLPGPSSSSATSKTLQHEFLAGTGDDEGAGHEEELEGEGDDDEDDEYDDGEQEYPVILGEEDGAAASSSSTAEGASKRRRERRKRLQDMFHKMKKGRFWEIREMQKERYGF
uniref:Tyrosine specific protein phosphatases domain-containing protein n=1 Tax=Plectus sambesii TaxID=2011161 RepID=A0A914WW80_9BILA